MSKKIVRTCDNCGKEQESPDPPAFGPSAFRGWIQITVILHDYFEVCSRECAVEKLKKVEL